MSWSPDEKRLYPPTMIGFRPKPQDMMLNTTLSTAPRHCGNVRAFDDVMHEVAMENWEWDLEPSRPDWN
ncbi:hypothetical protein HPB50_013416 [Hyalomma asiaticum]|uniref:Uncharacterized protein n=1 Tax=Hyalomma asiaticum TaxID=266040 RepID=A0ACB7RKS0_HYAAI|nr:hypothetical protein HPB50_013416 [Hyalomma asiaticum]